MCITVEIGKGSGTLFCHLKVSWNRLTFFSKFSNILNFVFHKDSYGGENPTHHGEVQFSVEDGRLFTVTSFKGDAHTGYVCFQASKASLSQNGKSTWYFSRVAQFVRKDGSILSILGCVLNSYDDPANRHSSKIHQTSRVDQVIYPSSSETRTKREQFETGTMLSLAIKITVDPRQEIKATYFDRQM